MYFLTVVLATAMRIVEFCVSILRMLHLVQNFVRYSVKRVGSRVN